MAEFNVALCDFGKILGLSFDAQKPMVVRSIQVYMPRQIVALILPVPL